MMTRLQRIRHEICQDRLDLIEFARLMRHEATDAESLLWTCLRNRRVKGRKFRRQHPIKPYVLDFYCAELRLVIELDGGQHNTPEGKHRDKIRESFLHKHGMQTLRFTNREMLTETDAVLNVIWNHAAGPPESTQS